MNFSPAPGAGDNKIVLRHRLSRHVKIASLIMRVSWSALRFRLGLIPHDLFWQHVGTIVRESLGQLKGPLMKVGQMLSYLIDEIPPSLRLELQPLTLNSAPVQTLYIRQRIEAELGKPIQEVFKEFEDKPVSVGSIGQVHRAVLLTGETVVVKVAHPQIRQIVTADLTTLQLLLPILRIVMKFENLNEIFYELKKLMLDETDFLVELKHQLAFQKIFTLDPRIVIPRAFPQYSTTHVLVSEYLEGKNFYDFVVGASREQKNEAAKIIWEFSAKSANRFRLFNADPHPGNYIFLNDGRVGMIDFGLCKRWESKFHSYWKKQTIAGIEDNFEAFKKASLAMGIDNAQHDFDFQNLLESYKKYSYNVWTGHSDFEFRADFVKQQLTSLLKAHQKGERPFFPKDLLIMTRLFFGIQTIMSILQGKFNVAELTLPYVEEEVFEPIQISSLKKFKSKLGKLVIDSVPIEKRVQIIRENMHVPSFCHDPRFSVQICSEPKEFEMAFALLHESYVQQGLMSPQADGVRCSLYSLLPETTTIIVKFREMVVGTLSLNLDSKLGLPSDSEFKNEIDAIRRLPDARLVEVTGFAVDADFRNQGHVVSLLLMKYLYFYSRDFLGCSHLVCAVREKVEPFYRALFLFERSGPVVNYRAAGSVRGIFLHMPISPDHEQKFTQVFSQVNGQSFIDFIFKKDARLVFPSRTGEVIANFTLTPQIFKYFVLQRTHILKRVTAEAIFELIETYRDVFGDSPDLEDVRRQIPQAKQKNVLKYRMPINIDAKLRPPQQFADVPTLPIKGKLRDITDRGGFLQTQSWKNLKVGDSFEIQFVFLDKTWNITGEVRWVVSPGHHHVGSGAGIKWNEKIAEFAAHNIMSHVKKSRASA